MKQNNCSNNLNERVSVNYCLSLFVITISYLFVIMYKYEINRKVNKINKVMNIEFLGFRDYYSIKTKLFFLVVYICFFK